MVAACRQYSTTRTGGLWGEVTVETASPFSLLDQPWLPARRADGAREWIRPAEITAEIERNPVVAIDWSRPDFDAATREFLIGLLTVAAHARAQQTPSWAEWFRSPPSPEELDAALAPSRPAFVLDGDGLRFLQDQLPLDGRGTSISQLLIDAPGEETLEKNQDHFVRSCNSSLYTPNIRPKGRKRLPCRSAWWRSPHHSGLSGAAG